MKTVIVKQGVRQELEDRLPADRTITIENSGYVSLQDTEFFISDDEVLEVINE